MKPFLAAVVAIVVISAGANAMLNSMPEWSSAGAYSTSNVRLD